MDNVKFFPSTAAARDWFTAAGAAAASDGAAAAEVWVGMHRARYGSPAGGEVSISSLTEFLADAGWAEAGRGLIDENRYAVRFAPAPASARRKRRPVPDVPESWEPPVLAEVYAREFQAEPAAWEFFQAQAPRYRETATWWVMSAKHEETRVRRLRLLIEGSAAGERLPQLLRIR